MSDLHRSLLPGCLAVALFGCSSPGVTASQPVPGFPVAQASADCAPWDGPAVTIYFTPQPTPLDSIAGRYLTVSIWKGIGDAAGRTWRWPTDESIGAASRCTGSDDCQGATAGEVTIDPVADDSTVAGAVRLIFAPGDTLSGRFTAPWRPRRSLCG